MDGLLSKARQLREEKGIAAGESLEGFTPEEREDLQHAMEQVLSRSRIDLESLTRPPRPRKKGWLLPAAVNVAAVLVVLGGIWLFSGLFVIQGREDDRMQGLVTTNEGLLLETMRREAEAGMANKNKEIADIQQRMGDLEKERASLSAGMQTRIAEKEAELRKSLQDELQKERDRLARQGLDPKQVEQKIAVVQKEYEDRNRKDLAAYQSRMDSEVRNLESNLQQREVEYRNLLDTARQDRQRMLKDSQEKLSRLQEELDAKEAARKEDAGKTDARLEEARKEMARIAAERDRQSRMQSQVQGWYRRIREDLEGRDQVRLDQDLDRFLDFLSSPELLDPVFQSVRDEGRYFAGLVRELARNRQREERTQGILEDSLLVEKARTFSAKARSARQTGNLEDAFSLYRDVLSVMPETAEAWKALEARQDRLVIGGPGNPEGIPAAVAPGTTPEPALALVRSALEAPDWDVQKQRILEDAQAGFRKTLDALQKDNSDLMDRYRKLEARLTESDLDRKTLNTQLRLARDDAQAARKQLQEAEARNSTGQDTREALAKNLAEREARVASLEETVRKGEAERDALRKEAADLQTRLTLKEADLARTAGNLQRAQELASTLGTDNAALKAELAARPVAAPSATPAPGVTAAGTSEADKVAADALRASLADLQTLLDARNAEVARLQNEMKGLGPDPRLETLEKSWQAYMASAGTEVGSANALQSRMRLDSFLASPEIESLFPGLYRQVREFNRLYEQNGASSILMQLSDIAYSAGSYGNMAERKAYLENKARTGNDSYRELLLLLAQMLE